MEFSDFLNKFRNFLDSDHLRAGVVRGVIEKTSIDENSGEPVVTEDFSVLEDSLHLGFREVASRLGNEALDTEAKILTKNDHLLNRAVMIAALFWFENNSFHTSPYFKPDDAIGTEKRFWSNVFPAVQEQIDSLIQLSGLRNTECFVL